MTFTRQCALHWTFLSSVRSANAEILTQEETISTESGILNNLAKVKVEQIDEYSTETTYVNDIKQITSLDFSEATFDNEEGMQTREAYLKDCTNKSASLKPRARELKDIGMKQKDIALKLGISKGRVSQLLKKV